MRRALTTLSILCVAVSTIALAAPARAADSFTFFGSGWGHGLGLSQYGAYGLSQQGWSAARILTHFYSSTKVSRDADPPASLRIGLAQGRTKIHVTAESGKVDLNLGAVGGQTVATVPNGETWVVRLAGKRYRIVDAEGDRVGDPVGGPKANLYAVYATNDARVHVQEALHTYNRGSIEFNIYDCATDCAMRLVLEIDPEPYLYGLAEVPSSWPKAALQAQAIAARTYAFLKADTDQHRPGCNCALYASSLDQVYAGWDKEGGVDGNRWVSAVDATAGKVVKYKGDLIQAFYTSSSGGYTENNENVWGGTPLGYLRGVCDPGDYTSANPNRIWQLTLSAKQVTRKLGLSVGTVTGFSNVQRGVSGRIVSVVVNGENGDTTIGGGTLRAQLGLKDDRVWINADRQVVGEIRTKYDSIGCRPGLPLSRQARVGGGERQRFQRATIFYRDGAGAHSLTGDVLDFYLAKGGPAGELGFPVSDVRRLEDGSTRAVFEQGTITCSAAGDCEVS
jgi:SpoIID/LytB domain protein